eukprot:CAMPEP_0113624390 /NCGR_PEP_ID=MMETSP0017_2-20120614/12568_1 /TAXON_ID=2856 /ORGANISM="Cylindrotheca closterium" /LENGTH=95 /DNA_ID=CAMNT_0000534409 /DNA_START=279 /DNA_END=567 /DNA_ORIENTATION=+ /assembly_acc=CAM_ASM_000147
MARKKRLKLKEKQEKKKIKTSGTKTKITEMAMFIMPQKKMELEYPFDSWFDEVKKEINTSPNQRGRGNNQTDGEWLDAISEEVDRSVRKRRRAAV